MSQSAFSHFAVRIGCLVLALCFAAGCTAVPAAAPKQTPVPSQAPSPVPTAAPVSDLEAAAAAAEEAFRTALCLDLSLDTLPEMATVQDIAANFSLFFAMADTLEKQVRTACSKACLAAAEHYVSLPAFALCLSLPGWQETVSLYRAAGSNLETLLAENLHFSAEAGEDRLTFTVQLAHYEDILGRHTDETYSYKLILAYMNTIYDDAGEEADYVYPEPTEEYIATLADPLPGHRIKDGWYAPRSSSTRKHTGTDIRAAEDTPILSCTDGTVTHISTNAIAGNYVAVLDAYGYEYHYYHMVRLTDFLQVGDTVKKGDVIGHVGNTGNSDANHLHLAVTTPDLYYLNPYFLLLSVREMQKQQQ